MPTTAERLAALETMVADIHGAVVGDNSKGSSIRERLASLEANQSVRQKLIALGAQALWTAAVAAVAHSVGLQLPAPGGHP